MIWQYILSTSAANLLWLLEQIGSCAFKFSQSSRITLRTTSLRNKRTLFEQTHTCTTLFLLVLT